MSSHVTCVGAPGDAARRITRLIRAQMAEFVVSEQCVAPLPSATAGAANGMPVDAGVGWATHIASGVTHDQARNKPSG